MAIPTKRRKVSLGSCITMMSSAFFVYVVYVTITGNQRVSFNPWIKACKFI